MTHGEQYKTHQYVDIQPTGKPETIQELWKAVMACGEELDARLPERS